MSVFELRTRRIVGEPPEWWTPRTVAFVAPRPLFGEPRQITATGWAGEVSVDLDSDRAADAVENNLRMDASVVVWVPREVLIAETRARLVGEYGADAVAGVDDDDILGMAEQPAPTVVEV